MWRARAQMHSAERGHVSGQSILIVDDEPRVLNALRRELFFWKPRKELTVYAALSAKSAFEILEENHGSIQVMVSDLKMGGVDGDELIRETRRRYPDIRCILITGRAEVRGVSRAVSAGITAFIPKPWETRGLIGEIEKAMTLHRSDMQERDRVARLVSQAEGSAQIHKRLFGSGKFPHARYNVEVICQPSSSCGGDFFQVFPVSEDRCILIIGRVAGCGPKAAFVTGIVRTLIFLEDLAPQAPVFSPAAFLRTLNCLILKELAPGPEFIITLTAVWVDCFSHRVVFSNAGSLPLYLIRPAECTTHVLPGFPCGFTPDAQYKELSLQTRRGDKIALMTDGLLEKDGAAAHMSLDAVRSLMTHFFADPAFNSRIIDLVVEMFPEHASCDDVTLMTVDIL